MRDPKINYVAVGIFVVLAVIGLLSTITLLAGKSGPSDLYYTHYPNVAGIKYGTEVLYEGYRVGQVEEITPEPGSDGLTFRVDLSIRKDWKIPADSIARISASGLLAAISIDIKGGQSKKTLAPGDKIQGSSAASIFAAMSDVAGEVSDISQNGIKPLLRTLQQTVEKVAAPLSNELPKILADIAAVSTNLAEKTPKITADINHMTTRMDTQMFNDANVARLDRTLKNLDQMTGNFKTLSVKLEQAATAIDEMTTDNKTSVDNSIKDLRYTLRAVSRHVDTVMLNLEGTSRNMAEFSRQIRQNPGLLISGTTPANEE